MEYGRGRFWHAHAATKAAWTCQNSPPADLVLPSLRVGSLTSPASASPGVKSQAEGRRTQDSETMLENAVGGVVAVGLLVYLLWALVQPERF